MNQPVHAFWIMIGALAVLAIAFRFYSRFLALKVAGLDSSRVTPAHEFYDGQNYHPTNKWVLFGHHFAAISGAGPLIGPVLAIQFGYLPGLIWLLIGVCLAGAVQDFMVLFVSTRRKGRSLAGIALDELGPTAGLATALAILYIIVIALAGLGIVVVKALGGEEVKMKAGTQIVLPADRNEINKSIEPGVAKIYEIPPGSRYQYAPGEEMVFNEGYQLAVPPAAALEPTKDGGKGLSLPEGARRLVPGSSWGTFTIACTVPIALFVGLYMYRIRKGKVVEASIAGALAVLAVTVAGAWVPGSSLEGLFSLSRNQTIAAIAAYGFIASVLPVWMLLCPRDYLSSFLKIGTIALLVLGVLFANPTLESPAVNSQFAQGGGPYFDGPIFPYVFICIMCGAISGFHALVSSGTTPKMVGNEADIRLIGYGSMLIEGLVGIVALIAAASLPVSMYYDINIDLAKRPQYTKALAALGVDPHGDQGGELVAMEKEVQESLHGRTGGAVTLAVGMARIFNNALPGMDWLLKYWYHFAIMFEALFILTTIDTGTRIGRFLLQELLGRVYKPLGDLDWLPASILSTGLIVVAWAGFIWTGSVESIWPMFGMANQLLAVVALCLVTTYLINHGKARYAPVTLLPMLFVLTTTTTAGYSEITGKFMNMVKAGSVARGYMNIGLTLFVMTCVAVILVIAIKRWLAVLSGRVAVKLE